jgi:hypothetical protein
MLSPQAKLKEIRRILALWPSQAADEGDELLRGYLLAVEDYPSDDVTLAVDAFVKGNAPGINPSFRPKPAEVGAECRRQMNLRLDRERREKLARPALPPPMVDHDPESRARIAAMVDTFIGKTAALMRTEEAEADARRKAIFDRTNARFDAERGYEIGDHEDHEAAA